MAKLAYYASPVPGKESWFETPEGYRIYKDARICRTGGQWYFGYELKENPGYDSIWDLRNDQKYEVFRPLEEVTAPETIASFEGKSVLDEHPADKALVDALDEYEGVSQGHQQNIRVGDPLTEGEFAGETPLLADLFVKNPDLNIKVEGGTQELSCGYRFILAKDSAGRLIMTNIRGNHVAVVPRGRAGPEIAIGDAAPPEVVAVPPKTEERKAPMSFSSVWRTLKAKAFQDWAKDAKPEEVADAMEELKKEEAKDAHAKDCDCKDCKGAKDAFEKEEKEAKDKAAKDAAEKEEAEKAAADKAAKDAEEKERKEKEEKEAKDEAEILGPEKLSHSGFSVGDALTGLEAIRPAVAKSRDKNAIAAYNALTEKMRAVRDGVKDGAIDDPFVSLVEVGVGVKDAQPERSWTEFFNNGNPYADNLKEWNAYLQSKGAR